MTTVVTLFRELYFIYTMMLTLTCIICVTRFLIFRAPFSFVLRSLALGILCGFMFLMIYDINYAATNQTPIRSVLASFYMMLPTSFDVALGALCFFAASTLLWESLQWPRQHITPESIRMGTDYLPTSYSLSLPNGLLVHFNKQAAELSARLTGHQLLNAEEFWNLITSDKMLPGNHLMGKDPFFVQTAAGQVYLFERQTFQSKLGPVVQITAVDTTREWNMLSRLAKDNSQIALINQSLRDYNLRMDEVIRSEEQLLARRRIHDNMGETLLAAKIYLTNPENAPSPDALVRQWKRDIMLLREEASPETYDEITRLSEAAEYLGLKLVFMGKMPDSFDAVKLISVTASECMTNAVKYSGATQLYISVKEESTYYQVLISNNGSALKGPIVEGGGLSFIRKEVEKAGGTMDYGPGPRFQLRLTIPLKPNKGGISHV